MVSNFCPDREPLRNVLLVLLLFLAGLVSACSTSITSGSSPTPNSTQGIRGIFHEYPLPPSQFVPGTITAGPDGNLWFTEIMQNGSVQAGKIGRMTPTGTLSEFSLPSADTPADIITGPDGNLWFTELDKIARITPMGKISEFKLSPPISAQSLATGPDGDLWFTDQNKIGRMTLTGKVSEYALPLHQFPAGPNPIKAPAGSGPNQPLAITAGPDGNLWFTEFQYGVTGTTAGKIGSITTAGKISDFPLPTSGYVPTSITFGTDHTLWFTEVEVTPTNPIGKNGKIGHLV